MRILWQISLFLPIPNAFVCSISVFFLIFIAKCTQNSSRLSWFSCNAYKIQCRFDLFKSFFFSFYFVSSSTNDYFALDKLFGRTHTFMWTKILVNDQKRNSECNIPTANNTTWTNKMRKRKVKIIIQKERRGKRAARTKIGFWKG